MRGLLRELMPPEMQQAIGEYQELIEGRRIEYLRAGEIRGFHQITHGCQPAIIRHVFNYSGGVNSWAATRRHVDQHGPEGCVLVFADTLIEDSSLYEFAFAGAENLKVPLVRISHAKTPWELFLDQKFLGNRRSDICSRILKRQFLDAWRSANCPWSYSLHVGLDWTEKHRIPPMQERLDCEVVADLAIKPLLSKSQVLDWAKSEGLAPGDAYSMGLPHDNCGGFCIKSGIAQFTAVYHKRPVVFWYSASRELDCIEKLGEGAYILRNRRGGTIKPLRLVELAERIQSEGGADMFSCLSDDEQTEWGGCGCAVA